MSGVVFEQDYFSGDGVFKIVSTASFLQRVSIACYAERCISHDRFCLTV